MKKISTLALAFFILAACTPAAETQTETQTQTTREMEGATQHEPEAPPVENMESSGMNIDENAIVFDLMAENFKFTMDGVENPELKVKEGDTVIIHLTSKAGFHDWKLDEFEADSGQVDSNQTNSVTFVASKKGEFEYYCSIGNHRNIGMKGKLIVE